MNKIQKKCIVTIGDCKELSSTYNVYELAPYRNRTGVVEMVDEDQEEAFVVFLDYLNEEHYNAEPSNWFPLSQLELTDFENLDTAEHK